MSRLITRNNLHEFIVSGCLTVNKGLLLSPGAADLAKIQGIQVIRSPKTAHTNTLHERITHILTADYGITDSNQVAAIHKEVLKRLQA